MGWCAQATRASATNMTNFDVIRRPPRETVGNSDTPHVARSYAPASLAPPARRGEHPCRGRVGHSTAHRGAESTCTRTAQYRAIRALPWRSLPLSVLTAVEAAAGLLGVGMFNMAVANPNLVANRIIPIEPRILHTSASAKTYFIEVFCRTWHDCSGTPSHIGAPVSVSGVSQNIGRRT